MSIKVSVIVPAYNAGKFICNAINSVLAQSYGAENEIIVIDDGSTDDTKTIVTEMSRSHPQIVYVANERTKGPSGARNSGLLRATGEYMAFLDADDLWLPNHLEEGVNFLENHNHVDVVWYNFEIAEYKTKRRIGDWFSERNFTKNLKFEVLDDQYHLICDDMFNALLDESFMHLQSMIIRKKALTGILFAEDVKRSEDRDFAIRLYTNSKATFAFKNIETGIYYRHENSLTSKTIENDLFTALDHIKLFSRYLSNEALDSSTATKLKKMIFERHISVSYRHRKLNNHGLAVVSLFKSFKYKIAVSQLKEFVKIVLSFCNIWTPAKK